MTRADTALKLLSLGPLVYTDFRVTTGWADDECKQVLLQLTETKQVIRIPHHGQYAYKVSRNHFDGQGDAHQTAAV